MTKYRLSNQKLILLSYYFFLSFVRGVLPPKSILRNPLLHPLFGIAISSIPKSARRVLLEEIKPSAVDARSLLRDLPLCFSHREAATRALIAQETDDVFKTHENCLDLAEVERLRAWAHQRMNDSHGGLDSVDGCPEWQVSLDRLTLESIIGESAVARLWTLPEQWLQNIDESSSIKNDISSMKVGIFVRRYAVSARPFIGFHVDASIATVNVALSRPDECIGGTLLLLAAGALRAPPRPIGSATAHSWDVCHGVSAVQEGERWSLILFFQNQISDEPTIKAKVAETAPKQKRKT